MNQITKQKNTIIYHIDSSVKNISIIVSGLVSIQTPYGDIFLGEGDCIGLLDITSPTYSFNYNATTDVVLQEYPFIEIYTLSSLMMEDNSLSISFSTSIIKQTNQLMNLYASIAFKCDQLFQYVQECYRCYTSICNSNSISIQPFLSLEETTQFTETDQLEDWLSKYYVDLSQLNEFEKQLLFKKHLDYSVGFILKANLDSQTILNHCQNGVDFLIKITPYLLSANSLNIFSLLTNLHCECIKNNITLKDLTSSIESLFLYLHTLDTIDKNLFMELLSSYHSKINSIQSLLEERNNSADKIAIPEIMDLTDSCSYILKYANCTETETTTFQELLNTYSSNVHLSNEEGMTITRKQLTSLFYEIYIKVFLNSLENPSFPSVIRMFLYFGFMDERLVKEKEALSLQEIAISISNSSSDHLYTFYDWLLAIYHGKKEPSRNEFDIDYTAYLLDLKSKGKITTIESKKLASDGKEKVLFELKNMFPLANKMTVGRITGYCPIFSSHNIVQELTTAFVSPQIIEKAFTQILSFDYTAYHRETLYSNPDYNITKEYIHIQFIPDIILMPGIGVRGSMWQEIEGKKRTSPARMILPIFSTSDVTLQLIQLTAEFRWELCKRIQGFRWNDVSIHSLTSDYCDYIQFYKKNKDLSTDAKEKIKSSLIQARNNSKTAFVQDYTLWLQYEGIGSPRLNKVARNILFTHCPFTASICEKLTVNPLYAESLNQHNLRQKKNLYRLNLLQKKLVSLGNEIPIAITNEIKLIEGNS